MKLVKVFIMLFGFLFFMLLAVFLFKDQTWIKAPGQMKSAAAQSSQSPQAVEINNYQGEKLDRIADFQENSIKGPQRVDPLTYRLTLKGPDGKTVSFRYDEVLHKPHFSKVVTLNCVEGWSVKILWEGVRIADLLTELFPGLSAAGSGTVEFGGYPAEKLIVKFLAVDGYSTSLPLKNILDKNLLLAYKINGVTLPPERGFPFQLVAEEKWGYKWIKWVQAIEVSTDTSFKGYWESRGFNQQGDLKGQAFDE
jgi:DMSO/TMAO reductase YedYZ molybdopterin-dependent catalytic subunit